MSEVSLVVWRDARTDPPEDDTGKLTDIGPSFYDLGWWWVIYDDVGRVRADPQPSVWCDPTPPGDDALTMADLNAAAAFLNLYRMDQRKLGTPNGDRRVAVIDALLPRLRRALEEAEGT